MENDIDKQLTEAQRELTSLRGKLPGPNMFGPDQWFTIDEAADLLGLSAHEAEQRLSKSGLEVDGSRRKIIRKADFDKFVIAAAAGKPTDTFL